MPDCYEHKQDAIDFESKYFKEKTEEDGLTLYRAPIDTTFSLYRPRIGLSRRVSLESYRMAEPYSLLHLPWYQDSANLDEEDRYYINSARQATMWSTKK